ncbi:MAG TPA: serine/threonine-protein phosphatase [Firmicutes bacterium]|nr:serine/threonine-protein phosphatase [Bacillota bacterium]
MSIFVEVEYSNLPKAGEELCGDSVEVARTEDSVIVVMADGLGSGVKANILSTLTTKIAASMLKGGLELDEVVETLSHTLPVCQVRKLAYSTFSIVQVFNSGDAYLAEFDNPPAFFIKDGKVRDLPSNARVIAGRTVREYRFTVSSGDSIVLASDGVIHAGVGGVLNLGWQWANVAEYLEGIAGRCQDAQSVARRLTRVCYHLYAGHPGDDATAVVLKVRYPRTLTAVVGPPRNREDDPRVARELMKESGKKVVCGGTTSLLIARELGRTIDVNLDTMSPDLPPSGRIAGIDLVTEGIITLSRARDILEEAGNSGITPRGNDGASALARMLLESDRIRFIVGRAINPAHQNPRLPVSLSLKMQVVSDIARMLERRGKQVQTIYF